MTLPRLKLPTLVALGLAFAAALGALLLVNGSPAPSVDGGRPGAAAAEADSAAERIRSLQAAIEAGGADARTYSMLGEAFVQRNRESGDPSLLPKAEEAFREARARDPRSAEAATGLATLAAQRHDFAASLREGLEARRLAPRALASYPVIVDAQIELGRYEQAEQTLQEFVDGKPGLASYARVSYYRELTGDLSGAVSAMRLAVSAGGTAPENVSYVQTLLGDLEFERGRLGAAAEAYRAALSRSPDYGPATAGLARVDAARGDLDAAIARYRPLTERVPLPEYVIALGEAELAAAQESSGGAAARLRADARRDFALIGAQQQLLAGNGVNTDVELAVFEADHGDRAAAVRMARRGYAAAPSVRSADALGWALTRAGRPEQGLRRSREALRLGWRDPLALYHAGIAARDAGKPAEARRHLARALAENPRFSPLHAPRARQALGALR